MPALNATRTGTSTAAPLASETCSTVEPVAFDAAIEIACATWSTETAASGLSRRAEIVPDDPLTVTTRCCAGFMPTVAGDATSVPGGGADGDGVCTGGSDGAADGDAAGVA